LLSGAAMQELDDEGLGAFARRLPWGSYGMLARASLTAPDLGVALKRWCRHHGLLTDDVRLELTVSGSSASITLEELQPLPPEVRELSIAFMLRNVHGLACWYVDSRIPLLEARFPFAAPPHADAYPHMFPGGPLQFARRVAAIRFDARVPEAAHAARREGADADAAAGACDHGAAIPARPAAGAAGAAGAGRAAPIGHSAEALAELLHVSARTLHRQLKDEGASLQQLKDEVRLERAKDLLCAPPAGQAGGGGGGLSQREELRARVPAEGGHGAGSFPDGRRGDRRAPLAQPR
jgi:AraC-like DNA-binding protein